ncbi:MAG: bifunctional DNA-formamidopyrimidine glycosylase/DNA-(apurinic or apyrimidinic site) lyase [Pseudomonadota bacterium]
MPELPEVETIARRLRPDLLGRRILHLEARWPRSLTPSPEAVRGCEGRAVIEVGRRGKLLLLGLEGGAWLGVHLRMSGRMEWAAPGQPEPRHARTLWHLDDGRALVMDDARKFGRVTFTYDMKDIIDNLGPEPLSADLSPARFAVMLANRRRALKPLLLDQAFLAGLGNIYTDEALFRARLHPLTPASSLSPAQAAALLGAVRAVLAEAIAQCGTSLDWIYPEGHMQDYLRVYGRAGQPCPACGAPIVRGVVGQRGTWTCPRCQPAPSAPG